MCLKSLFTVLLWILFLNPINSFSQETRDTGTFGVELNSSLSRTSFNMVPTIFFQSKQHKVGLGVGSTFIERWDWAYEPFSNLEVSLNYKVFPFNTSGKIKPYFMAQIKHLIFNEIYFDPFLASVLRSFNEHSHYFGGGMELNLKKGIYLQSDMGLGLISGFFLYNEGMSFIFPASDYQFRFGIGCYF
ncbi:MAG: hypothetical protein MI810_00325 [Flavobacteriales bacterium]|nr:hypothetical protein [Flavobacteriales bacterium]